MKVWNKNANTAVRKHGKPGRELRPKSTTIDAHAHIAIPRAAEFVKPYLDVSTVPLAHFSSSETKQDNAKQEADVGGRMVDAGLRFADMDEMGVDVQLVMPPPTQLYHAVAIEYAAPTARMINESVAEFASHHTDRFIPFRTVPMQHGQESAKELEHCVRTFGFKGVEILTNVAGKELSDPAPFWKKAEDLDAPVVIHPNGFTEGKHLSGFISTTRSVIRLMS